MYKFKQNSRNIVQLLQGRELNAGPSGIYKQRSQFTENVLKRLTLEAELEGHRGCVNCLQWYGKGDLLASGSDDTNVILWDPFEHRQVAVCQTPHIGNIFSVKFLTDRDLIATAAADCKVIVQHVHYAETGGAPLLECECHMSRVKRLAVCPEQPVLFWSASEDGFVIQYDLREGHDCTNYDRVLIDSQYKLEMKCIAINPTRSQYLAVGSDDCFVRVYDRRMIRQPYTKDPECVQLYAPGHLTRNSLKIPDVKMAVTYIAFNATGTEMLSNIGGEQIYLFDVNKPRPVSEIMAPINVPRKGTRPYKPCCASYYSDDLTNDDYMRQPKDCVCYYMKRAFRSYQRRWLSDLYCAAHDYLHVIKNWPDHNEAYLGLIKCMVALKWCEEAQAWFDYYLRVFPNETGSGHTQYLRQKLHSITIPHDPATDAYNQQFLETYLDGEYQLRLLCNDYEERFLGHCNTTTDIKECNFFGDDGRYICAGSDEGVIFIWDKETTGIINAFFADNSIVNCVQPHPTNCLLASSGIDATVKLWSPGKDNGIRDPRCVRNLARVVETNQHRMWIDPFETMLASLGYDVRRTNVRQEDLMDDQEFEAANNNVDPFDFQLGI